jgi:hypothetical protein
MVILQLSFELKKLIFYSKDVKNRVVADKGRIWKEEMIIFGGGLLRVNFSPFLNQSSNLGA